MSVFPLTIDINPTAKCNMSCRFCWGPNSSGKTELNLKQWFKIINFFAENGTKSVVFTGGEPLLYKNIIQLMRYAKNKNLKITLSTNTLLLKDLKNDLLKYVDDIGVPLDGCDVNSNINMRKGDPRQFISIINSLDYIKKTNKNIFLTVRTVLSKKNFKDIEKIGKILQEKYTNFDRWKIYQFSPFGRGHKNKKEFFISSEKFLKKVEKLKIRFKNIDIDTSLQKDGVGKYIFINPQGDIYGVKNLDGDYKNGVNFFSSTESEIKNSISTLFLVEKNNKHGI